MTPMIDVVFLLLVFFMLTMHFKEVEGKLISHLPKDYGPHPEYSPPELQEIRITICANGNWREHLTNKGKHEKVAKPNEVCVVLVDQNVIGQVFRTETGPGRASRNRSVYRALAAKVAETRPLLPRTRTGEPARVILDPDSEVPYEHVIGAVNACKEVRVHNVEFVANSKFMKYAGGR